MIHYLKKWITINVGTLLVLLTVCPFVHADEFVSEWPQEIERIWVGKEYWANRLQDWRTIEGRLECVASGANRNVHLLTHQVQERRGAFQTSVRLGRLGEDTLAKGWSGFRIGAKGYYKEYRDSALYGKGLHAGITTAGTLFIGQPKNTKTGGLSLTDIEIRLTAEPDGNAYKLTLAAIDPRNGESLQQITRNKIKPDELTGNLALVCHKNPAQKGKPNPGQARFWFKDWKVSGDKIEAYPAQTFGPILFAQHTLSKNTLKITAQMPPIGAKDNQTVRLKIREKNGTWKTAGEAPIHPLARTATIRVDGWDSTRDVPYWLVYALKEPGGKVTHYTWGGTIRHDPIDKETIVVAGFTGNNDLGFPNDDIIEHVFNHDPDLLVFTARCLIYKCYHSHDPSVGQHLSV